MEAGVALITTDAQHMPSGMMLPFYRHHRQAEIAALQIGLSLPLRKRLWQAIVRAKIGNQAVGAGALRRGCAAPLRRWRALVGSGDPDNVEARAARHYWGAAVP